MVALTAALAPGGRGAALAEGVQWTRVSGSFDAAWELGVYGTRGSGTPAPTPGGRFWSVSWTDAVGTLWLFGGASWTASKDYDFWNDLWQFDPRETVVNGVRFAGAWRWVAGASTANAMAARGALGVAAVGNTPGARGMTVSWTDAAGDLWLFGGYGPDGTDTPGCWNDLWRFDTAAGTWTWVKGAAVTGQAGVYGTRGVAAAANTPGARYGAVSWTDAAGGLWLFGGVGQDQQGTWGFFNDLWKYTPSTGRWTWVHGSNALSQPGVYGTRGVAAAANTPGGRDGSAAWTDAAGDLWLFGGRRQELTGAPEFFDDLWKYSVSTGRWTWVKGASTPGQTAVRGEMGVAAAGNTPGARWELTAWTDTAGRLWLLGGQGPDGHGEYPYWNDLWRFDPPTGEWTWAGGTSTAYQPCAHGYPGEPDPASAPGGRYAAVAWTDAGGRFWLFGGEGRDGALGYGALNDLWRYDVALGAWAWIAGATTAGAACTYESHDAAALAALHPGARSSASTWSAASGSLWLFGGYGRDAQGSAVIGLNDLWRFDVATGYWTWVTGSSTAGAAGTYGTRGVGRASTTPGARFDAESWTDAAGTFWLFGGKGRDAGGTSGYLNDLWRYDTGTAAWVWVHGSSTVDQRGVYGARGVAAPANTPGARGYALSWTDAGGAFWLFGGYGYGASAGDGFLSDLWKLDPASGWWTWVSGPSAVDQPAVSGTRGVAAAANTPGARSDAAAWTDATGTLWLFGGDFAAPQVDTYYNDLWKLDPASGNWTWVAGEASGVLCADYGERGVAAASNIPGARIAAATWTDAAGRLWMFGGWGLDEAWYQRGGLNDLWRLDPADGEWTWMAGPTTISQPGVCGVPGADDLPGSRNGAALWKDARGRIWLFGGWGVACGGTGTGAPLSDLWSATVYDHLRRAGGRRLQPHHP